MNRDEILDAIREAHTVRGAFIPTLRDIRSRMREVDELADQYPDHADGETLAEALQEANRRFADMIALHL